MDTELPTNLDGGLNEASWLSAAFDAGRQVARLQFDVLTLPDGPGGAGHALATVVLGSVARTVASLRLGRWDDPDADVVPLNFEELPATVASFGSQPVYGLQFFDPPNRSWEHWRHRLSLDERWAGGSEAHFLHVFQEVRRDGKDRHLDVRIWFGEVEVQDERGNPIPLREFADGAQRWWDALNLGDDRVTGFGIHPLKP